MYLPPALLLCRSEHRTFRLAHLLRTHEFQPVIAGAGEYGPGALCRVRPSLVLLDAQHPAAESPIFHVLAAQLDARVVVTTLDVGEPTLRELARAEPLVVLPEHALGCALRAARRTAAPGELRLVRGGRPARPTLVARPVARPVSR